MSFIPPYQETAAILAAQNPVVPRGVLASETDTGVIKVGDGVTRYNSLSTALSGTYAMQTGGVRKVTGPTLPAFDSGTKYVWEQTDSTTGDLMDIITGVA